MSRHESGFSRRLRSRTMTEPKVLLQNPLARRSKVEPLHLKPNRSSNVLQDLEEKFLLDCIITEKLRYKWSPDVIPKYDAESDPHARFYFMSPNVQQIISKTMEKTPKINREQVNVSDPETLHRITDLDFNHLPDDPNSKMEDSFILDCISAEKLRYKWSPDVIPQYDAVADPHAQRFFMSPLVLSLMKKTMKKPLSRPGYYGSLTPPDVSDERFPISRKYGRLSLSARHRLPPGPSDEELQSKRKNFTNNSVFVTNQVTRYKPLVAPYNSIQDLHAKGYVKRSDVQKLMRKTMKEPRKKKVVSFAFE